MSSVISASTTSTTALTLSGDTSGQLEIKTGSGPTTAVTITSGQQVQVNTGGSASAPVISKSDDTNTGIYFPAADTIAFTTDGTDKLRINSSGNVGIAVTSSAWSAGRAIEIASVGTGIWGATGSLYTTAGYYFNSGDKFAITGNYAVYSAAISADASFRWYSSTATGTAGNAATMSERMRIDSSGNVGIGTSSPYTPLDVNGYFSAGVRNTTNFPTSTAAQHYFGCSPSDLARNNIVFNINGDNTTPTRLRFYKSRGTSASPTATNSGDLVSDLQTYTYDGSGFIQASGLTVALSANSTTNNVSSYMSFATNGGSSSPTERMRIDSSGNVLIGTTNYNGRLTVTDSVSTRLVTFDSTGTNGVGISLSNSGTDFAYFGSNKWALGGTISDYGQVAVNNFIFGAGNAERMRLNSSGYLKASPSASYISTAGTYHEFDQNASNQDIVAFRSRASNGTQYGLFVTLANDQNDAVRYFLYCQGGGVQRASFYTNGGLYNYSANNVNLASDERLKKDISPLANTWNKVKQIEVVNFRYKDCAEGDPLLYGVIAQQVQPIVPELVVVTQEAQEATEDKEATPEYYGIREQPMYWLAIKALQEAMERIEKLEAEIQALKGER